MLPLTGHGQDETSESSQVREEYSSTGLKKTRCQVKQ
jgi:hypothetical protein